MCMWYFVGTRYRSRHDHEPWIN